ncbi:hypothetical protein GJ496_004795 [Pomphorhynchus laevis]|nr:hypothetical protein GJ496_004795 [Pomphorhynchus laevis]
MLKELNAQSIVSDQDDLLLNELFSLLVILSQFLEQHMQVIIPYIIDIIVDQKVAISSRRSAVLTLTRLVELVDARMFTSGILVPLMRIGSSNSSLKTQIRDCIILLGKQVGSDLNIFKRQLLKAFPGDMLIENLIYDSMQSTSATFPILQIDRRKTSLSKVKSSVGHSSTSTSNICRSPTSLNIANLVKNWEWAQELCKEDVSHWFQAFRLGFFTESTSPSINACRTYFLDSYNIIVARLFNISFMSCWASLGAVERDKLVCCISHVLSTFDDAEFGRAILELVEFFDHHSTIGCLPFDLELLSKKSIQLRAYASALQYAEKQFQVLDKCNNTELIETLISVNNELDQLEAAHGALMYARYQNMPIKELWYEKLGHWSRALRDYEFRQSNDPANSEILLGRMRCLEALGDWSQLHDLCSEKLKVDTIKFGLKQQIANIAAPCAWALESWDSMSTAVSNFVNNDTLQSRIYSAVLMLKQKKYRETHNIVRAAWGDLHLMYTSLFTRDYSHINDIIGQAQSLIELEEVIQYASIEYRRPMLRNLWRTRLTQWCEDDFYVWYRSLLIQSIVLPPLENQRQWIALVDLCSKTGKEKQANHIFATMLNIKRKEPITIKDISGEQHPFIYFAFLKHKRTVEIMNSTKASMNDKDWSNFRSFVESLPDAYSDQAQSSLGIFDSPIEQMERDEHKLYWRHFKAECYYTLAQRTIEAEELNDNAISRIQKWFETAISYQSNWREIWNDLANFHYKVIMSVHYSSKLHGDLTEKIHDRLRSHVIQCHNALYKSILLGTPISALQNILRFITLWFQFGNDATILRSLNGLLSSLPVETWLQVIPQLISRIDCKQINVAKSVQQLLASIGRKHPQALIYSLAVASKSDNHTRQAAANSVLISLRHHSDTLVQQALLISEELIRISILWHEHWYGALDEASRLNINEHDIKGCLELLLPLHKQLEKGGETLAERAFIDTYGQDLERAYEHWKRYRHNNEEIEVSTAWQIYYKVYNALRDQLAKTTTLDLKYVSPKLLNCRNLELAIPGTYEENKDESSIISIQRIDQQITVISSKQRPRKLSMMGSDGKRYLFLLKGHEDLRQDQRAMQLFVLINSILAEHPETSRRDLAIGRYSVVPLAPDNGLISWLHQCDTLHSLIRQYREETKIPVYLEYSMIKHECPFYGRIPLLARIEVFRRALSKSDGLDLARIIWNKSPNADVWFTRRTNYVRSLAVMSMVGYIIGLGDRHPSNLMIDRFSGKVIHIDFGDCFEVAMKRKRFPETIPFRLTRMLINAMEVTGEQGIFRQTCQIVMALMRRNRESLIAVLEAFVYDPLASWRLNVTDTSETYSETEGDVIDDLAYQSNDVNNERPFAASISIKARYNTDVFEGPEMLNNQALAVLRRVKHKLTGRDFPLENENEYLSPEEQVTLLIKQAKSEENLCRCYFGWCPFW